MEEKIGINIKEIGKIPYMANGGTLLNGAAIVAEAGPELLLQQGNKTKVIPLNNRSKNTNLDDEVSKFLSGFKMIYCNFVNVLKNYGVIEIDGNNKPFDPVYHEAIMTEKRDGVEAGMVLEVLQKGYILKGKVIRPAMVKVSE